MKMGIEGQLLELSAEDTAVALHAYDVHGYRIVGLKHDGAYSPEVEPDGRLVVDAIGATALKACVFENVKYNLDFLYGKWVTADGTSKFKPGFIENRFTSKGIAKSAEELKPLYEFVDRTKDKIRNNLRVNLLLMEFLEQEKIEETAA